MRIFKRGKDGGPKSNAEGFWLIEWKPVFSIALLKLDGPSREAFHTHAFNSISWVLKGKLTEKCMNGNWNEYPASFMPVVTKRSTFHQVSSDGPTWALTFRGAWTRTWLESRSDGLYVLSNGRKERYANSSTD